MSLSLEERMKLDKTDLSGIGYIVRDNTIYFRESELIPFVLDESANDTKAICEFMVDQLTDGKNDYGFKIITDSYALLPPGMMMESCHYIKTPGDTILEDFDILNAINEKTSLTNEMAWSIISKALAKFKKGDYKEAPTIEYRLKKCKNELESKKKELEIYLNSPNKKQINQIHTFKTFITSLTNLGIGLATPLLMGKASSVIKGSKVGATKIGGWGADKLAGGSTPLGKKTIALGAVSSVNSAISSSQYEIYLKNYIADLEGCVSYLENELKNAGDRDKKRVTGVKESFSINSKSISETY